MWAAADVQEAREFLAKISRVTVDIGNGFARTESDVLDGVVVIENLCHLASVEVNAKVQALQKVCMQPWSAGIHFSLMYAGTQLDSGCIRDRQALEVD